VIDLFVI